jgi:hypothetical protein
MNVARTRALSRFRKGSPFVGGALRRAPARALHAGGGLG